MLRNLRDLGFGKSIMEDIFVDELGKLCQMLIRSQVIFISTNQTRKHHSLYIADELN